MRPRFELRTWRSRGCRSSSTARASAGQCGSPTLVVISVSGLPTSDSMRLNSCVLVGVKRRMQPSVSRKMVGTLLLVSRLLRSFEVFCSSATLVSSCWFKVVSSSFRDWSSSFEVSSSSLPDWSSSFIEIASSFEALSASLAASRSSIVVESSSRVVASSSCSSRTMTASAGALANSSRGRAAPASPETRRASSGAKLISSMASSSVPPSSRRSVTSQRP